MLNILDSFQLLKELPITDFEVVSSDKDLSKINFPYYMKSTGILHKTEQQAVIKCNNLQQAKENLEKFKKFNSPILIQKEVEGIEMIIGLKQDSVFGKLLLLGFGGIHTETVKDTSFRALPVDRKEIEKMLKELKLYPSLKSRKKYAIQNLINLAEKISKLNIKEADFNPVIVNEQGAFIVDARITI